MVIAEQLGKALRNDQKNTPKAISLFIYQVADTKKI